MSLQKFESELITQIIYLDLSTEKSLENEKTEAGSRWSEALEFIAAFPGLEKLYWGHMLEEPEKVQLHLGKLSSLHFFLQFFQMQGSSILQDKCLD